MTIVLLRNFYILSYKNENWVSALTEPHSSAFFFLTLQLVKILLRTQTCMSQIFLHFVEQSFHFFTIPKLYDIFIARFYNTDHCHSKEIEFRYHQQIVTVTDVLFLHEKSSPT